MRQLRLGFRQPLSLILYISTLIAKKTLLILGFSAIFISFLITLIKFVVYNMFTLLLNYYFYDCFNFSRLIVVHCIGRIRLTSILFVIIGDSI